MILITIVKIVKHSIVYCDTNSSKLNTLRVSKDLVNEDSKTLSELLIKSKHKENIITDLEKIGNEVNRYEDITVLDDDGHIKTLKYKSVNHKTPVDIQNLVDSDLVMKLSKVNDKKNDEKDVTAMKSKFFDDIGRKYLPIVESY